MNRSETGPDGISCVGLTLLLTLVLAILGVGLSSQSNDIEGHSKEERPSVEEGNTQVDHPLSTEALPENTNSPTPTASSTPLMSPTPLPTNTPDPTATSTPMPTPSPISIPTEELVKPDLLPTFTPTPSPTPLIEPTPQGTYSRTLEVPILMYHYISQPPEEADEYREDLSVLPDSFRAQMAFLVERGYTSIDLYDLSLAIVGKKDLPAKPIIITLDDGYRDNYENAFPVLRDLGLTATFFVTTEFVDNQNPVYLTWPMIEEMARAGMRIEPHSKTHPDLREQERAFIIYQVLGSQETIAAHIGYTPRYFAYPGGRYDEQVLQIIEELDFWGAVVTAGGTWHGYNDRFEWKRVRIRNTTSLADLVSLLP